MWSQWLLRRAWQCAHADFGNRSCGWIAPDLCFASSYLVGLYAFPWNYTIWSWTLVVGYIGVAFHPSVQWIGAVSYSHIAIHATVFAGIVILSHMLQQSNLTFCIVLWNLVFPCFQHGRPQTITETFIWFQDNSGNARRPPWINTIWLYPDPHPDEFGRKMMVQLRHPQRTYLLAQLCILGFCDWFFAFHVTLEIQWATMTTNCQRAVIGCNDCKMKCQDMWLLHGIVS